MKKLAVGLCVFLLIGCSAVELVKEKTRMDRFADRTRSYGQAIRWGQWYVAKAFVKDPEVADLTDVGVLKKFQVISYDLLDADVSDDKTEAMQAIGIKYYHAERLKEKSLVDRQEWKYDEEDKTWYLKTGLPDFK
ncbi:MAG: hypothetical protein JRI47_03150 [Deltaproteobacteria bacterium]|nr:hypothetical protein [Deltaproteobacteria bacterium]